MNIDINITNGQIAYFFMPNLTFRTFELTNSLYQNLKAIFHTEPQTVSLTPDAPPEIPRCIWADTNTNLTFNAQRLDFKFNKPSSFDAFVLYREFNDLISQAVNEQQIPILRIGIVAEAMTNTNVHDLLNKRIDLDQFTQSKEVNISWREVEEIYNVWTYISLNDEIDSRKLTFDINTSVNIPLAEKGICYTAAATTAISILERKVSNVVY